METYIYFMGNGHMRHENRWNGYVLLIRQKGGIQVHKSGLLRNFQKKLGKSGAAYSGELLFGKLDMQLKGCTRRVFFNLWT